MRTSAVYLLLACSPLFAELPKLIGTHTQVIAHRGGTGPDSTKACIQRSLERGDVFIELDVRLSKDGKAVVIHDATVDRTTNGQGKVADLTFAELRKLDAGAKYTDPNEPTKSFKGEQILTPEEVLQFVGDRGIVLLELKVPEAAVAVVKDIQSAKAWNRAIVRNADLTLLTKIHALDPKIQTGTIAKIPLDHPEVLVTALQKAHVSAITPLSNKDLTAKIVSQFHEANIAFWATNTNDLEEMKSLINAKVAGIITDSPVELRKLLDSK